VEPLIRQRATLLRNVETGQSLNDILADRADPMFVMDLLTRALPDDTSLLGLNIQGSKVSINGSTSDAAALMQQLSSRPELREVKAPTPATRPPGTTKDSFNIEFTLASAPPRAATVAGSQRAAALPAASAAAVSASASVPVVPAAALLGAPPAVSVPQSPAPQPSAAPAARSGGASFGGATFGAPSAPAKAP
jgi:general secretion pathway protein L